MLLNTPELLIAFHEGRRLLPYQDIEGIWTGGIGHNFEANGLPAAIAIGMAQRCGYTLQWDPNSPRDIYPYPACMDLLKAAGGLTDAECDALFTKDYANETAWLRGAPFNYLSMDPVRRAVLDDMTFNLGQTRFQKFDTFLGLMGQGDYAGAAADLANTAVDHQLPKRYGMLCSMLTSGEWPNV